MELFHAHQQWKNRPADERFSSLETMHDACKEYASTAREARNVRWDSIHLEDVNREPIAGETATAATELYARGPTGQLARITHHAFGQLAARAKGPAGYLRTLPAGIAATAINYGLRNRHDPNDTQTANLLIHQNGGLLLRAATSEKYARIWNHEILARLIDVCNRFGLVPARPTFRQTGDDAPALYASDHDMFAFVMTAERAITDPTGQTLFRGVIVRNSEVGDGALSLMGFLFREICGNHIIWGATEIAEIRLVHLGDIRNRWQTAALKVRQYLDGAASLEEAKFREIGANVVIDTAKEKVIDVLFRKLSGDLPRKTLTAGFDAVNPEIDSDPRTPWGMVNGLTRHSQTLQHADERTKIDKAAGKILQIAW